MFQSILALLTLTALAISSSWAQEVTPDECRLGVPLRCNAGSSGGAGRRSVLQRPLSWVPFRSVLKHGSAAMPIHADPVVEYLEYYGGPVVSNVEVVVVIWGNADSDVTDGIGNFYNDLVGSSFMDLLSEYSTTGFNSGTNQEIGYGTYKGTFVITPSAANNLASLSDTNIQNELNLQIQAGVLPPPTVDTQGSTNTAYMVYFPLNTTITSSQGGGTSCVNFCAYHSNAYVKLQEKFFPLYYSVFPSYSNPGCPCEVASSTFDSTTAFSTHELAELVTDPQVGQATILGPPLGWTAVVNFQLSEVADLCIFDQGSGPGGYNLALIWSNMQQRCVLAPAELVLSGASPTNSGDPVSVTITVRDATGATLSTYLGTVTFSSTDLAASVPANYTFTKADAGTHTFTFTPRTAGTQTLYVHDVKAQGVKGSSTAEVLAPVAITVGVWPVGPSFNVDGQSYSAPVTFEWWPGSSHLLAASPQQGAGPIYVFDHWSDGGGASHNIQVADGAATYTAYFGAILERTPRPSRPDGASLSISTNLTVNRRTLRLFGTHQDDVAVSCSEGRFRQNLCAAVHQRKGTSIATPAPKTSARGETPASRTRPAMKLTHSSTSMVSESSAAKTRPRNLSSVFSCSSVVEKTHTPEVPACAQMMSRAAIQIEGAALRHK